jgi:Fur family ferric uptake transcriptional regulator
MTRSERAVLAALEASDGFRSAQELHAELRAGGERVGLTSVYRALQSLADRAAVDVVRQTNGELTYRRCASDAHHHHLLCRTCGATVEIEAPALEQWVADVAATHGYTVTAHTLEVTGTCRACTGSGATER